jgi:sigma-E factor negative regulatory protein RseC
MVYLLNRGKKMQEEGRVISIENDKAFVQINIGKACQKCNACDKSTPIILEADNSIGANVGQQVKLETKIITKIKGIIFYLILPPIVLVFGIIAGSLIANYFNLHKLSDIIGIMLGLALFTLSLLFAYWLDKNNRKDKKLSSKVIEIIPNSQNTL